MNTDNGKRVPYFSICVPVYNAEKTLKRCIDSILNQTCGDFELLVCDDKSTDHSLEILKQYAKEDPRVKVLANDVNLKTLMTRKKLFSLASGEYSMWMDSDDALSEDFFERAAECFRETPDCDILEFPYEIIWQDGRHQMVQRPSLEVKTDHLSRFFLGGNRPFIWYLWSKFFRTSIVKKSLPPDFPFLFDDVFYGLQFFHYAQKYRWVALDHPMYHYYFGTGTWSPLTGNKIPLDKFQALCKMRQMQVIYNTQFAIKEQFSPAMIVTIVNFADLQSLAGQIAGFPEELQVKALEIFYTYFCKGDKLINGYDLNIPAQPMIERLIQLLPNVDPLHIRNNLAVQ